MVGFLRSRDRFLLTTHDFPDGDGLGSQMALHRALVQCGKTSFLLNPSPTPLKYSLVDPGHEIRVFEKQTALPDVQAVLVLDTGELSMMGPLAKPIADSKLPVLFIDHHVSHSLPPGPHLIDESSAATAELVFRLRTALGVDLDLESAQALYLALATDTGWFRYARTSPFTHTMAAQLLAAGVEPEALHRSVFARETPQKLRFLGHCLEKVQLTEGGQIAWLSLSVPDRNHYGATVEDTESYLGFLANLEGVRVTALFREEDDGRTKISLRGLDGTEVIGVAQALGGGGHRFAAGARVKGKLEPTIQGVLQLCSALVSGC
jgi:bifunctional oligoribonuclease and PAP phosphatase NrnA